MNLLAKLEKNLDADALRILKWISEAGHITSQGVYLVGGSVRDLILCRAPRDAELDIAVVGEEGELVKALDLLNPRKVRVISKSQHRTLKAQILGFTVEFAAARSDIYNPWGSLPRITLVDSIEQDLARRDFSVNAMAVSINAEDFGTLIDPFRGRTDCEFRTMRLMNDDSFREDPTRMMRGVRLASRLGFCFHPKTETLMHRDVDILRVFAAESPERTSREFRYWFGVGEPTGQILESAARLGLVRRIAPEIRLNPSALTKLAKYQHNLDDLTRFAFFAIGMQPPAAHSLSSRMKMPQHWREVASHASKFDNVLPTICNVEAKNSEVTNLLSPYRVEVIEAASLVASDIVARGALQRYLIRLRHIKPACNGQDLVEAGIDPGPRIGFLLNQLRDYRLDGIIRTKEEELEHIRNSSASILLGTKACASGN